MTLREKAVYHNYGGIRVHSTTLPEYLYYSNYNRTRGCILVVNIKTRETKYIKYSRLRNDAISASIKARYIRPFTSIRFKANMMPYHTIKNYNDTNTLQFA